MKWNLKPTLQGFLQLLENRATSISIKQVCIASLILPLLSACDPTFGSDKGYFDDDNYENVYISDDHVQCNDYRLPISETKEYLTSQGIKVYAKSCGDLHLVYATVCGNVSGSIHIFAIDKKHADDAENLGFTKESSDGPGFSYRACDSN